MTGVTIMQMERGLDTGPMLARWASRRSTGKTAGELTAELARDRRGADGRGAGSGSPISAPVAAARGAASTYAPKIEKQRGAARFQRSRAVEVERQVRAFNPAPGACFEYGGERIKILAAELFDG